MSSLVGGPPPPGAGLPPPPGAPAGPRFGAPPSPYSSLYREEVDLQKGLEYQR